MNKNIRFIVGCSVCIGLIIILNIGVLNNRVDLYGNQPNPIQYNMILFGSGLLIVFIIFRLLSKPIETLKYGTAKLYFSITINFLLASYASFGIAFSILWGNLYTYAIEYNDKLFINNLMKQGMVLFFFVIVYTVTIVSVFLWPLLHQIKDADSSEE